ncbi:diguanylate cyclase/phosphodiesterase (GGDEF & EAL domains) with PAS/PAC sensor(s) [Methylophaga frappieri]|uniref:Diguanylate cyclase/phosphodiesterase (GGDEF & EAL domains) with PAS/PAC sensor(S) n=1 Tax=Methylophaga frappieri (strain ATCC BAA-2434 / DSM 25690 / JAM7) TaxID=754477 RepID=I1YKG7_METFJ|nr:EAL domain-containing protein [Methylophaga frappieri]AFJ03410.1 diguanylate cyclase/phosphodiesterase (GGDEF & EAL domains) with PAS/PAC sensor(s) [Methylophaga frappieri]
MTGRRQFQFHWQSARNCFFAIALSGTLSLGIVYYLISRQLTQTSHVDLGLYFSLAFAVLVLLALLLSGVHYFRRVQRYEQLITIGDTLPLLSAQKYEQAKQQFAELPAQIHEPEIAKLRQASLQLTNKLEQLAQGRFQRAQLIQRKSDALRNERDFIKSLLDTAQLVIMTIDDQLQVTLINAFAQQLTGYAEKDILETDVARLFPAGNWLEARARFQELLEGRLSLASQEAELIDRRGQVKHISWLHSRLANDDERAVILSVGMDITHQKEAEKRIVWLAEHDPLTDLCNRRKFTEEFEKSLRTAVRYHHNNTLLYLDLDQFKDINDTSGHKSGDELLNMVAKTLKQITRFTDLVARLGGDEFAVLMPESDDAGARILAQKILSSLASIHFEAAGIRHKVSASIGIVHYPLNGASIHELMSFADLAMYQAKSTGKNNFHVFSPDDQTRQTLETRVFWKNQIENALENQLFILHFQPILELSTNAIDHYEVLIRMYDPATGETCLPGKFIDIAEQTGLIRQIDRYVVEASIKKLAELQQQKPAIRLAINLSAAMIDSTELLPLLKALIRQYRVEPSGLIFEVTETVAVANLARAKTMMQTIKTLGCQFALDDFGVGFSSFNYIRELPVDIIKIDGIFIKDLHINADDQLFVKALIDVATGLGRRTVAEFVENHEVLTLLRSYGVNYAQGFYIGRPADKLRADRYWSPP